MNISVSVTDFPLFISTEYLFQKIKEAGADGVEVVTGVKSRFRFPTLLKLSEKYHLPITSIHQPPWSIFPHFFDEDFIRAGKSIGVNKFVFHPLPKYSFSDRPMKQYLEKLAKMQEKFEVTVMLENMPVAIRPKIMKSLLTLSKDTTELLSVLEAVKTYNLQMTLDTSHAYVPNPAEETWFTHIFPRIANIHLSSFDQKKDHLPVYMGDFQTLEFLSALKKKNYEGLLTFEIYYPELITWTAYDFDPIKKSIDMIRDSL